MVIALNAEVRVSPSSVELRESRKQERRDHELDADQPREGGKRLVDFKADVSSLKLLAWYVQPVDGQYHQQVDGRL